MPAAWFARGTALLHANPRFEFLAHALAAVTCYVILGRLLARYGALPASDYAAGNLLQSLLTRVDTLPAYALVLLAMAALVWRRLLQPWTVLDGARLLRGAAMALVGVLLWYLLTLPYNFYFDSGYYPARVALAVCAALAWWRPIFLLPFLLLTHALLWQLTAVALGGSILAHKLHVVHGIEMILAAWMVRALLGGNRGDVIIFLLGCQVAGAYWTAFYAKVDLGWLSFGHLYYALPAAWTHGWLGFFSGAEIAALTRTLAALDWPMRVTVLLIEGGCLFLLARRGLGIALLGMLFFFHCAVFLLLGFLFWTWMVVDLVLIVLLWRGRSDGSGGGYATSAILLSVMLIGAAPWWSRAPVLGWFDTPVNYAYRWHLAHADGTKTELAPGWFGPYDDVFTMASFAYAASTHPVLVGPYGVTGDRAVARELHALTNAADMLAFEALHGQQRSDPPRAARLGRFVGTWLSHRGQKTEPLPWLVALAPPRQFWSFRGELSPPLGNVAAAVLTETTYHFDGHGVVAARELELLQVAPAAAGAPERMLPESANY